MPSGQSTETEAEVLLTGLAMGESPRWHDDRLWLSDWRAQEIIAVGSDGNSEVVVPTSFGLPFCIDWLPDGRLLIVSGREGLLLRRESDGAMETHADLRHLSDGVPDGICIDVDNAVWYADVPNKRCVREGGEVLQTISLDRGCFACMLGGAGNNTLFLITNEWRGMENIPEVARARTGQVLTIEAPAPHAGWP